MLAAQNKAAKPVTTAILRADRNKIERFFGYRLPKRIASFKLLASKTAAYSKIVVLGNSIARHPPLTEIDWLRDWDNDRGMLVIADAILAIIYLTAIPLASFKQLAHSASSSAVPGLERHPSKKVPINYLFIFSST